MRTVLRLLISVAILAAFAVPALAAPASAATVPTRHLSAKGGTLTWTRTVDNAKTCTWSSSPKVAGFDGTVKCNTGRVTRSATFRANTSSKAKGYMLMLTVRGNSRAVWYLKVVEAGKAPRKATVDCRVRLVVGVCQLSFTTPDAYDAVIVAVDFVKQDVANPAPGIGTVPGGDQLDVVAVSIKAGSTGMGETGAESNSFALALAGGGQGSMNDITDDSSVPYAMGALGPEAPNTVFEAVIYYDVPIGSTWTSVNFDYNFTDVYAFVR
jgi:hypothetical protein